MLTKSQNNKQKRETKHIRIGQENHKRLKFHAIQNNLTMSQMADEIFNGYFSELYNKSYDINN